MIGWTTEHFPSIRKFSLASLDIHNIWQGPEMACKQQILESTQSDVMIPMQHLFIVSAVTEWNLR